MKLTDISTAQDMGIELEIAEGLQAGFPSPAQDHAGETIDLAREMVRHPESTFYARIAGNSMIEAGIHDGSPDMTAAPAAVCMWRAPARSVLSKFYPA